ncbi:hypothetical protein EOD41_10175 [Mucilaginibacter limnophilus]|uniref:Uncharacterized protein n=1 Tax=Mucilaginibacter limnophilus TaxID=1932778 RepID=A0A3S2UL94_9SPHI|nr:hypothetical protein EOD41_10175 [Mucilaginibacter limnophilus]
MRIFNGFYSTESYLPSFSSKNISFLVRLAVAATLVALLAISQSCSKKSLSKTIDATVKINDDRIVELSLSCSVQVGETLFGIPKKFIL